MVKVSGGTLSTGTKIDVSVRRIIRGVAMPYQTSAYFIEGSTLKSKILHLLTPTVHQKAFFRREGRIVRSVEIDIRGRREDRFGTIAEAIDEVDFVEIVGLQHAIRPNRNADEA
jgi:hypothetical protein